MGPGAQEGSPFAGLLSGAQWDFATSTRNYTLFRADPVRNQLEVSFVDANGTTLFARRYENT